MTPVESPSTPTPLFSFLVRVCGQEEITEEDIGVFFSKVVRPVVTSRRAWIKKAKFGDGAGVEYETLARTAMSEIWACLSSQDAWAGALTAGRREADSSTREKSVISYLYRCADRCVCEWCGEGSVAKALRVRIRRALRNASSLQWAQGRADNALYGPADASDPPHRTELTASQLCESIHFPPLRGASRNVVSVLPTESQIREVLADIMRQHRTSLTMAQCLAVLQHGWQLTEDREDELDREDDEGHKAMLEAKVPPTPLAVDLDLVVAELLSEIEQHDGCGIDRDNANGGKEGKLGRMFVEFGIWQDCPVPSTPSGGYGIEMYAAHSGYGKSTENVRWRDTLLPLMRSVFQRHDLSPAEGRDVIRMLRERFRHRKPEFVEDHPL